MDRADERFNLELAMAKFERDSFSREGERTMNRSSDRYVGTVANDEVGLSKVAIVRATISKINALLKAGGSEVRWRVSVKGRLGKNNPNAHHYRRGGRHWRCSSIDIRREHSTRFDLYVYRRYS